MRLVLTALLASLCACAEVPALDSRIDAAARDAPYPQLINLKPVIAQAGGAAPAQNDVADALAGDIANLQRRADALRGPVIEPQTRTQLARDVDTSALR